MDTVTCAACGGWNPAEMRFCGHCAAPLAGALVGARTTGTAAEEVARKLESRMLARHIQEAEQAAEERRLVTAVFADLSGFTALADTLDPDGLVEAIDPIIMALSEVVAKYEGFISKFAGDALLALFGAPVSHEDDAARALLASLEMRQTLDRIRPDLLPVARHMEIHIGVNTGYAAGRLVGSDVRMLYDVLGDAVNLAQRLESSAPLREIYVGETTHAVTRDRFEFENVGELTLKGKAQPVNAWRLLGERRRTDRGRGRAAREALPLIGREKELDSAERVLARLREGRSSLIALVGEPGVGKTRLTEEIERHARQRSMVWQPTHCVSYGSGLAYWPYAELLRGFAGIERSDAPEQASSMLDKALRRIGAGDTAAFLARLMGVPVPEGCDDPATELEPEAFKRELHAAVARWAEAVARQGRVVIVIEDFHWADQSSIELTRDLAHTLGRVPVALLVSGRNEAAPALQEIVDGLPEEARCMIRLEGLGPDHIPALIESILGSAPPVELAPFVAERAAGNPFFVEALVRTLEESGTLFRADGGWRMRTDFDSATVPPTVEGVVSGRIDLLAPDVAGVLQVGSVIGRRILVPLLRAVLDDQPDLERKLDTLVDGGFLDPADDPDVLSFRHALVQDVAYARLLRRRRRDLHLKLARAGKQLYGEGDDIVDLLARHLYLGGAGLEAVDVLIRAGERAKRLFANEVAIEHLERAVEVAREDQTRWPSIALDLADTYQLSGRYEKALTSFAEVREVGQDIRAWCGAAATHRTRGEYEPALMLISERIAHGDFAVMELSRLLLEEGATLAAAGRYPEAIQSLQAGLDAAGNRRNDVVGMLLLALARAETAERRPNEALEHGLVAQKIFEEAQDLRGTTTAFRVVSAAYHRLGSLDAAADALRQGLALAERVGSAEEIGACLINLGMVELDRGEPAAAIACDRRAIEQFERVGGGTGRVIGYGNLAEKLVASGELDEAEIWCLKALELARSIQHGHTIADATRTLAVIRMRQSRYRETIELAEDAAALFGEMAITTETIASLRLAAEALECAGDLDRARELIERARSLESEDG